MNNEILFTLEEVKELLEDQREYCSEEPFYHRDNICDCECEVDYDKIRNTPEPGLLEDLIKEKNKANRAETVVIKTNGGLSDREKSLILWFMELAVKMKMKDYTELSIASIDLEAWYEDYYKENELPFNALEMDEREGL